MLAGAYHDRPILEHWGRTQRWLSRLREVSREPLIDPNHEYDAAFEVSDHVLAVLGCCDAMNDWLRKSAPQLEEAVVALYKSPNLRICKDVVNTSKHLRLRIDRRRFARRPLTVEQTQTIRAERRARGETQVSPEEFLTTTEPFFAMLGLPARLKVLFPGTEGIAPDLLELCEACVAELGVFIAKHKLGARHEGDRRTFGFPRARQTTAAAGKARPSAKRPNKAARPQPSRRSKRAR